MISAAIITKNESHNIERCLKSLKWVSEVVVADSGSTDNTVDICKAHGCRVIETPWLGFAKTKQLAVDHCTYQWVLVVDADEVISDELQKRILSLPKTNRYTAYCIKRNSFYLGKEIRHSGWGNDYTLRLFLKNKGRFNDKLVHESVVMQEGPVGTINEPILHYTYPTINTHLEKMLHYARLGAQQHYGRGKRTCLSKAYFSHIFRFLKMYVFRAGFLDGKAGLILAWNAAFGVYLKYLFVWEMQQNDQNTAIKQKEKTPMSPPKENTHDIHPM